MGKKGDGRMETFFRDTKINCRNLYTWNNLARHETVSVRKVSSFYRITYVWQGYCRLYLLDPVTGETDEPLILQKGDFCYMPPGVWYYTETPEGMENTNIYFYCTTPTTPPEAIPEPEREVLQRGSTETPQLCPVYRFTDIPMLSGIFSLSDTFGGAGRVRQMLEEWTSRYRYADEMLDHMTAELLLQLVRHRDFQSRPSSREAADLAIRWISEHFCEKIDCRIVAKELGYHPNYLNTVIKDTTGMSLHSYIIDTKIRHAMYLVSNTDMRIAEIAAHLSFNDASHFTNVYTAHVGISPTGQRKQAHKGFIQKQKP